MKVIEHAAACCGAIAAIALGITALAASAAPAPSEDVPAILVSRQLLERHDLKVGGVIRLAADASGARARSFRIVGSYEPMPDPMLLGADRLEARMHLPDLLALAADPANPSAADSVTSINVALANPADARRFARELMSKVPGVMAGPSTPGEGSAGPFVVLRQFHRAIALVTAIASAVFLLALMVMRVDERRETVGILRLIGFRKGRILLQVFAEGLLIAFAGAVMGLALAALWQPIINAFFQWRYDTALVFVRVTPSIAWRSLALAVPLGMLASVVSSWTLLRRDVLVLARR